MAFLGRVLFLPQPPGSIPKIMKHWAPSSSHREVTQLTLAKGLQTKNSEVMGSPRLHWG